MLAERYRPSVPIGRDVVYGEDGHRQVGPVGPQSDIARGRSPKGPAAVADAKAASIPGLTRSLWRFSAIMHYTAGSPEVKMADRAELSALADPDDLGPYLARLGERVRILRTRRGMSRKALAKHSDVSERYLAQLEGGTGNCSVVLLRRIARALSVPLAELVDDRPDRSVESVMVMQLIDRLAPEKSPRQASSCAGASAGRPSRDAARPHRADRAARRRQIDARPAAGGRARMRPSSSSIARSSARAAWRSANCSRCSASRRFAAWSGRRSKKCSSAPALRAGDRRRPGDRGGHLRAPARVLLHRLGARGARRIT